MRSLRNSPGWAAVLSFLFPGLGQAAAGRPLRGAIIAIPAVSLFVVFVLAMLVARKTLLDSLSEEHWRVSVAFLNVIILGYRAWAIVDAYLVSWRSQELERSRRFRTARGPALTAVVVTVLIAAATHLSAGAAHLPKLDPLAQAAVTDVGPSPSLGAASPSPSDSAGGLATPSSSQVDSTPTPGPSAQPAWVSTMKNITVRSGPGTDSPTVGRMGRGVVITGQIVSGGQYTALGKTGTDWIRIDDGLPMGGNYVAAGFFTATVIGAATPAPGQ